MRILHMTGICRENRRTGKAEHMILLKILDDRGVHIAELAAVALVKDDDDVLLIHRVSLILADEGRELLNGRDNDPRVVVLELLFEHGGGGVGVCRALFKAVVFLHGLVVEVFSVHDKQHLVNVRKLRSEPHGLEARQRLAASGGMPDIAAALDRAVLLIICCDLNAVEDAFCRGDLIRAHDHQHFFGGKNTITRQDVEQRMLGKKRLCKVDQVGNDAVVRVRPKGSELKAVGGLCFLLCCGCFVHGIMARGVGIIFCVRAVGDDKDLHILKQSAACKKLSR